MPRSNNTKPFDLKRLYSSKLFSKIVKLKCNKLLVHLLYTVVFTFSFTINAATPKVVMLGDSISAGYGMTLPESWPALLDATFESEGTNIKLINESISGETTGGGLARINNVIKRQNLGPNDWVIVELGGNDGLRGFPIATIKTNLSRLIKSITVNNINVAIMQVRIPPNYGKRYTQMFENIYADLSEDFAIPLTPFFMDTIAINPSYMQQDGIHPNKSAQVIIRDIMKPEIEKLITNK
jgi:acyl-CoA thioesterase I